MEVKTHMPGDRIISDLGILAGLTINTTNLDLFGFLFLLTSKNPVFFIYIRFTVVFAIWFGWNGVCSIPRFSVQWINDTATHSRMAPAFCSVRCSTGRYPGSCFQPVRGRSSTQVCEKMSLSSWFSGA